MNGLNLAVVFAGLAGTVQNATQLPFICMKNGFYHEGQERGACMRGVLDVYLMGQPIDE